jgi:thymidine phosphorylase
MVRLGEAHGVHTTALLTRMQTPLGRTAGNALEVTESVQTLQGRGPADVTDLTVALAEEMLALVGLPHDTATVTAALHDGRALASWNAMVRAQGGDPAAELPGAAATYELVANDGGFLTTLDALAVGVAAWRLGAGRARKEDPVSFGAGIELLVREGEAVEKGQPLMRLHTDDPLRFGPALDAVRPGITIGPEPGEALPIVIDRIRA